MQGGPLQGPPEGRSGHPEARPDPVVGKLHADYDAAAELRALTASLKGETVACGRGCAGCCEAPILIYEAEARHIAAWLLAPENAEARAGFLGRYAAWREAAGDMPETLPALLAGPDRAAYETAQRAAWRKRNLCAFNQGGDCTIYPVRPLVCRHEHALRTPAACAGDAPPDLQVIYLRFAPADQFFHKASTELRDRIPGPSAALCLRVFELISSAQP